MTRTTRFHLGPRAGIGAIVIVLVMGTSLSTFPAVLFPLYASSYGLDQTGSTLLFASYAVGSIAGLLIMGRWAGSVDLRFSIVLAAALEVGGAAILAVEGDLALLYAGRILCGLGVGLLAASALTLVACLADKLRPRPRHLWQVFSPSLFLLGLAAGPILGALANHALGDLYRIGYAVIGGIVAMSGAVVCLLAPQTGTNTSSKAKRVMDARLAFPLRAGVECTLSFSVTGTFAALTPRLFEAATSPLAGGGLVSAVFLTAVIVPLVLQDRTLVCAPFLKAALPLWTLGLAGSIHASCPVLAIASMMLAGASAGGLYAGAFNRAIKKLDGVNVFVASRFLICCGYAGLTGPVIGVGLLLDAVGPRAALLAFAAFLAAGALATSRRTPSGAI